MNKLIIIILFFASTLNISAQIAPMIEWQNTIGGSERDILITNIYCNDGGYFLGGYSYSDSSGDKSENNHDSTKTTSDFWIVKVDSTGNPQWQKTIGGNKNDELHSMCQTMDGGYVLAGKSMSNISFEKSDNNWDTTLLTYDYWIVKIDSSGNKIWDKTIGGTGDEELFSIQQTFDGGFILGGSSFSDSSGDKTENNRDTINTTTDYWVVKVNTSGNIEWEKTFGGSDADRLYTIIQTTDGGFFIGGSSQSGFSGEKSDPCKGSYDYWIIKTDSAGNILWQKTIGGDDADRPYDLKQTFDGGYILCGTSMSNISGDKTENSIGATDYWIVKIDITGIIQWQNTIGGNSYDDPLSIQQTIDSGYITGGSSYSDISGDKTENRLGFSDYWIVKLDNSGNVQWENTIGGNVWDDLTSVIQTDDGSYFVGGSSMSNIFGDKTENSNGEYDFWIIKLGRDSITGINEVMNSENDLFIYPNPTQDKINLITPEGKFIVRIFDMQCREIKQESVIEKSSISHVFELSNLASGSYLLQVETENQTFIQKLIKL